MTRRRSRFIGCLVLVLTTAGFLGGSPASSAAPGAGGQGSLAKIPSPPLRYDDLPTTSANFALGPRWPFPSVTFAFTNGTPDIAGSGEHDAVRSAFALWSRVSALNFSEKQPGAFPPADIQISWATGDHGPDADFDGPNGVLAHATFPWAGDIHFDDAETWTDQPQNAGNQPIDLVTVAAHEIGHAVGLDHSTDPTALMAPFYVGSHRFLAADDIVGAQTHYGPNPSGTRVVAQHSGKCLDVAFASMAHAADVIQGDCWGGMNQQWRLVALPSGFFNLVAMHSGKCLDVAFASMAHAADVVQGDCWGGTNQQWRLDAVADGSYDIVARHSGKCLDVAFASTAHMANVIQGTCSGGANQRWRFT